MRRGGDCILKNCVAVKIVDLMTNCVPTRDAWFTVIVRVAESGMGSGNANTRRIYALDDENKLKKSGH